MSLSSDLFEIFSVVRIISFQVYPGGSQFAAFKVRIGPSKGHYLVPVPLFIAGTSRVNSVKIILGSERGFLFFLGIRYEVRAGLTG